MITTLSEWTDVFLIYASIFALSMKASLDPYLLKAVSLRPVRASVNPDVGRLTSETIFTKRCRR
jgi:hypothetical protein